MAEDLTQSKQLGNSLGNLIKGKYGSKSNLQQNLQSPMFGQGEMKTVDGSKSFNAQLQCPSTEEFLTVSVLPSSTGDIRILVRQDTDFDGKFDYSIDSNSYGFKTADGSPAGLISGVCANGVIVCKPGTWDSCTFWRWTTNDGKLAFEELPDIKAGLGGCYCINSSCGNIVWSAMDNILSSLGGGAVGAINESNTRVVISRSDLDVQNLTVSYYGQDSKNCKVINGEAEDVEKYYSTGLIPADEYKVKQESDSNSPYYSLINSPAVKNVSVYTCEVKNLPPDPITTKLVTDRGYNLPETCIGLEAEGNGIFKCYLPANVSIGCGVGFSYKFAGSFGTSWNIPDDPGIEIKIGSEIVRQIKINSGDITPSSGSYEGISEEPQQVSAEYWNIDACNGQPTATFYVKVKEVPQLQIISSNTCNPSDKCKLRDRQICDWKGENCVYVIRNFTETSINLLPQCYTTTSSELGQSWKICADGNSIAAIGPDGTSYLLKEGENSWFWIKETYECEEDNQYDFDPKRTQTILESASPDTGDYHDTLGEGHIPLDNLKTEHEDCPIACIVKIPKNAGTVYSDETTKNTTTYQREVRTCEKDENGNYHCPISAGEEIEQDCGCVDGFGLAATTLQAIHEASKDIICSSSPP
jgi:hypothetical protein